MINYRKILEMHLQGIFQRTIYFHIFPNVDSANRLIGVVLIDLHEEWISSDRMYIQL